MSYKPYRKQDIEREHNISEATAEKWILLLEIAGYPFERVPSGQERLLGATELTLVRDFVLAMDQGASLKNAAEQAVKVWELLGEVDEDDIDPPPTPYQFDEFLTKLIDHHNVDRNRLINLLIENIPKKIDLIGFLISQYDRNRVVELMIENLPERSKSAFRWELEPEFQ